MQLLFARIIHWCLIRTGTAILKGWQVRRCWSTCRARTRPGASCWSWWTATRGTSSPTSPSTCSWSASSSLTVKMMTAPSGETHLIRMKFPRFSWSSWLLQISVKCLKLAECTIVHSVKPSFQKEKKKIRKCEVEPILHSNLLCSRRVHDTSVNMLRGYLEVHSCQPEWDFKKVPFILCPLARLQLLASYFS